MMKRLFYYADEYVRRCNWKHLALLKFCLFAMGILAGMQIPAKNRERARVIASIVFTVTYIPLMTKFLTVITDRNAGKETESLS